MTGQSLSLAIIIATYNRAESLRETLENMCRINRDGISVMFYVVNNNSTDSTESVIKNYADRLPLHTIFEPTPGKNSAMNRVLKELGNEDIIVFTDDDVTPCNSWFQEIITICGKWPDHSVFGGRILISWPDVTLPAWAHIPEIMRFGFSHNDYGDKEIIYPDKRYPFGPNFWIRKQIFQHGRTFDERVGPRPKNKVMGGEIEFLRRLREDGYEFVYSPNACVKHRIEKKMLTPSGMMKRTYARGKGFVYMVGLPDKEMLLSNPPAWYLKRIKGCIRAAFRFVKAFGHLSSAKRFERIVSAITLFGISIESIRTAMNHKNSNLP